VQHFVAVVFRPRKVETTKYLQVLLEMATVLRCFLFDTFDDPFFEHFACAPHRSPIVVFTAFPVRTKDAAHFFTPVARDLRKMECVFRWGLEEGKCHPAGLESHTCVITYVWGLRVVKVDGDVMAVGAYGRKRQTGVVYVFMLNGAKVWEETDIITASDGASGGNFGYSVALAGSRIAVGAPNANSNGQAYVYTHSSGPDFKESALL
jgi:hypothetical protein